MAIAAKKHRVLLYLLAIIAALATAIPTYAAGPYVVDGQFGEWIGAQNIVDPAGGPAGADINYFYWGTNANDNNLYFMIQRYSDSATGEGGEVDYTIFIDTDDNGTYTNSVDRRVSISYKPKQNQGQVAVEIQDSTGDDLKKSSGDWGQSTRDGALMVEAKADFATLGIVANQTIRIYVLANGGDRAPDSGDIQYAPTPILDYPLLAVAAAGLVCFIWWKKGRAAWKSS